MKRLIFISLIMILALQGRSQYKVEVETGEKKMSQGKQTAFTVVIPETQTDQVENLWRKYVNVRPAGERIDNLNTQIGNIFRNKENRIKRDRLKTMRNGEELHISAVDIKQISNFPLDVYATVIQLPQGSQLSAFFQYSDSTFINEDNTDEDMIAAISVYVRNFALNSYRTVMDNNIKEANKALTREQNRMKDLRASTLREEKSILRDKSAIQEYNARISQLRADSANLVKNIEARQNELTGLAKDSAEYSLVERQLQMLEKDKSRYSREIRSYQTRIKSKELDIESAKNQIASNELEIDNQTKIIENKQQVAEQLIQEKEKIE
ncbi:MAG: hypothetical protein ACM3P1_09135 [Candidatus Saccharibacteria bacterium]